MFVINKLQDGSKPGSCRPEEAGQGQVWEGTGELGMLQGDTAALCEHGLGICLDFNSWDLKSVFQPV